MGGFLSDDPAAVAYLAEQGVPPSVSVPLLEEVNQYSGGEIPVELQNRVKATLEPYVGPMTFTPFSEMGSSFNWGKALVNAVPFIAAAILTGGAAAIGPSLKVGTSFVSNDPSLVRTPVPIQPNPFSTLEEILLGMQQQQQYAQQTYAQSTNVGDILPALAFGAAIFLG
jgi:hypothetical protein